MFYYVQKIHESPLVNTMPENLIGISHPVCSSVLGLVGHLKGTAAAETTFRTNFPGLPWLSDSKEGRSQDCDDGDDDDDDAVDALLLASKLL